MSRVDRWEQDVYYRDTLTVEVGLNTFACNTIESDRITFAQRGNVSILCKCVRVSSEEQRHKKFHLWCQSLSHRYFWAGAKSLGGQNIYTLTIYRHK